MMVKHGEMLSFNIYTSSSSFSVSSQFFEMQFPERIVQQKIQLSMVFRNSPGDELFSFFVRVLAVLVSFSLGVLLL